MTRNTSPALAANLPPALRAIGRAMTCPRDGWVFRKGDVVQAAYVVLEGEVHLSRFAKDCSEIALHRAGRGDFFAEAAVNAPRYHCYAIASRPATLLAFPVNRVRALLAKDPEFAREWPSSPASCTAPGRAWSGWL